MTRGTEEWDDILENIISSRVDKKNHPVGTQNERGNGRLSFRY